LHCKQRAWPPQDLQKHPRSDRTSVQFGQFMVPTPQEVWSI
jgi:hypothetical protein